MGHTLAREDSAATRVDDLVSDFTEHCPRGTRIGRYVVLGVLGQGGMGVVYRAYDPELTREVALKVLRVDRGGRDSAHGSQKRLRREAQAMARISHPNVLSVYDAGLVSDQVFIAMEMVRSQQTLGTWLEEQERPWPAVVSMFRECAKGLDAAHRAGFVHRDFKPHNVLIGRDGRPRVMDFGLVQSKCDDVTRSGDAWYASEDEMDTQLTHAGCVVGTPRYMSPEQHRGELTDARADQFSFCIALFEALYGIRPFGHGGVHAIGRRKSLGVLAERPTHRRVPKWLDDVLVRGLASDPNDRWPSMAALFDGLTGPHRSRRRFRPWLVTLRTGALGVIVGMTPSMVRWGQKPSEPSVVTPSYDRVLLIDAAIDHAQGLADRGRVGRALQVLDEALELGPSRQKRAELMRIREHIVELNERRIRWPLASAEALNRRATNSRVS